MSRFNGTRSSTIRALEVVVLSAIALASPALAAKPPPAPTPTCASGVLGEPTFAFMHRGQIYVGNADGTCALALAPIALVYPMAFAFDGARYRVFWMTDLRNELKGNTPLRWAIKTVEFTVTNGSIDQPRPLPIRELWRDDLTTSESELLGSVAVDGGASRLLFVRRVAGVSELKQLDLASCATTCAPPTTLLALPSDSLTAQFGHTGRDRIYYVQRSTDWTWWELGFFELQGNVLSDPRAILDSASPSYQGGKVTGQRVSAIFRGVPSADDFVSFSWTPASGSRIEVVQVSPGCVAGLGSLPCLDEGSASRVAHDIATATAASVEEWAPPGSLFPGYLIRQMYNADGTKRLETIDPLSHQVLVNHGVGVQAAALKQ